MTGLLVLRRGVGPRATGIEVDAEPDSPAARAGIKCGDIIVMINGFTPLEWNARKQPFPLSFPVQILRDDALIELVINLPSSAASNDRRRPAKLPSEATRIPLLERILTDDVGSKMNQRFYTDRDKFREQILTDLRIKDDALLGRFLMLIATCLYNKPAHQWHFMAFLSIDKIREKLGCRKEEVVAVIRRAEASGHIKLHRGTGQGKPNRYEPVLWSEITPPQIALSEPKEIPRQGIDQISIESLETGVAEEPTISVSRAEFDALQRQLKSTNALLEKGRRRLEALEKRRQEKNAEAALPEQDDTDAPPSSVKTPFRKLPANQRDELLGYLCGKYGWDEDRALDELDAMSVGGLMELQADKHIDVNQQRSKVREEESNWDPRQDMYRPDWGR